jgi:hypothetical protein
VWGIGRPGRQSTKQLEQQVGLTNRKNAAFEIVTIIWQVTNQFSHMLGSSKRKPGEGAGTYLNDPSLAGQVAL